MSSARHVIVHYVHVVWRMHRTPHNNSAKRSEMLIAAPWKQMTHGLHNKRWRATRLVQIAKCIIIAMVGVDGFVVQVVSIHFVITVPHSSVHQVMNVQTKSALSAVGWLDNKERKKK